MGLSLLSAKARPSSGALISFFSHLLKEIVLCSFDRFSLFIGFFSIRIQHTLYWCFSVLRKKERNKHSWHIFFLHFLLYFSISIQHNSLKCGQHLLSPFPYPVLCIYFNFVKISCTKMHTVPTELSCASIWVLACSSLGQVANVKSWPSLAWLHSGQSPFSST